MRSRAKALLTALTAGGLALSMTACTGGAEENTTPESQDLSNVAEGEISGEISFQTWSLKNDKFTPYFEELIDAFEAEYPDVTINWMDQPGDGYEDKLLQQANSDELPDVVNIPPEYGAQLARAGKLMDLQAADAEAMADYVEGGLGAYQYPDVEGSFGYPWYLGVSFNYWNTAALEKAGLDPEKLPTTEEEFLEQATTAASKGVAMGNTVPSAGFLAARGVDVFDEDANQYIFNSSDAVEILQSYIDLYQAGGIPAELISLVDNGSPANQAYYNGTLAVIQSTPSFATDLATNAPSLVDGTTVSEPWETPQLLVQGIAVSANSENPAAALAFAQFVTNNENQVNFVKIAKGFMPGTIEGNENPESFAADDDTALMKAALEVSGATVQRAELLTPIDMTNEMKTAVNQEIALALQGNQTAQEALDKAVEKCNSLIVE